MAKLTSNKRHSFEVPPGYEAIRDADGRATGEVRAIPPSPSSHLLASVQRPIAGFQIVEEISEGNGVGPCEQHHRHATDKVGKASALLNNAPAVVQLSDGQISDRAARDLHEPRNSAIHEELHVARQLVATAAATSPAPSSHLRGPTNDLGICNGCLVEFRNGETHGPVKHIEGDRFPWQYKKDDHTYEWTLDGKSIVGSQYDIMKMIPSPQTRVKG